MAALTATGSLTRRTIWRVALRIGIVVAIATVVSFWHVRNGLEGQALEQLGQYIEQRSARESVVFELAADNLTVFTEAYDAALRRAATLDPRPWFEGIFELHADGTMRLSADAFTSDGITGFIGKHVEVDDDLKRRLIVAFDVLARFGPAWRSRFVNLYAVTPEASLLMYWPDQAWTLDARDWQIYAKLALAAGQREGDVVVMNRFVAGIAGQHRWSDLYFDYGANDWMVSVVEPVNRDGNHLISIGQDILLTDLIERTLTSEVPGTYNMIFRADGRLVAHPRYMEAIQARGGTLAIQDAGDPHLEHIFAAVTARETGEAVIENELNDELLAVTRLSGPGWYMVTVFPRSIISARAFETAQLILILGAVALLIEILVLFWIMRRQITEPLKALADTTRNIASGRFQARVPIDRDDEIGELARSVKTMASEIEAREAALSERSAKLGELNKQLEQELRERERAELELAQQREALHQSEKLNALGSLLAGVAHELNNPLSVVVGRSMMLEDRLQGTPDAPALGKLRDAAERCAKIVKTFLALARQETPARQPVHIADVIQGAHDMVGYGLRTDSVAVDIDIAEGLPEISADPNQLIQVFTNLLVNAQHALTQQEGPKAIRIAATLDKAPHEVVVTIADNGPGIPRDIISRVFEPFFTTKPVGKGTGLGLSVCRGLIEAHGGTINARAPKDGGTVFEIRLPARGAFSADADAADEAAGAGVDPGQRRILIVEDEPDVAQMLAEVLQSLGHETEIASSGAAALDLMSRSTYHLILSDMRMPDMDGRALFERIRSDLPELEAQIVFVTGDSLSAPTARFLDEAKRPVIEKPFTPSDVRRVITELIAGAAEPPDPSPER